LVVVYRFSKAAHFGTLSSNFTASQVAGLFACIIWGKFLHLAEWHYNSAYQTSTRMSPYQVVYGKPPPSLPQYIIGSSAVEAVEQELNSRDHILSKLKANLLKAQNTMKAYADRHRISHPFHLGDLVWVKLQPYR